MKTSIDFLPQKKQNELHALCKLIKKTIEVEMIVLFGSYARNEWKEDVYTDPEDDITYDYISDFDVLVIVKEKKVAENLKIWNFIEDKHESRHITPATLIAHDITFVNRQLREGQYFFTEIIHKDGIILYNSKRFVLETKQNLNPKRQQRIARDNFSYWIRTAKGFYNLSKDAAKRDEYELGAFQLHQSTERLYHTILLIFTGNKPKVHDLTCLGKKAKVHYPDLKSVFPQETTEQKRLFRLLRESYTSSRYDKYFKVTKEDLEYLWERVKKLEAMAEEICEKKIQEIGEN